MEMKTLKIELSELWRFLDASIFRHRPLIVQACKVESKHACEPLSPREGTQVGG